MRFPRRNLISSCTEKLARRSTTSVLVKSVSEWKWSRCRAPRHKTLRARCTFFCTCAGGKTGSSASPPKFGRTLRGRQPTFFNPWVLLYFLLAPSSQGHRSGPQGCGALQSKATGSHGGLALALTPALCRDSCSQFLCLTDVIGPVLHEAPWNLELA